MLFVATLARYDSNKNIRMKKMKEENKQKERYRLHRSIRGDDSPSSS